VAGNAIIAPSASAESGVPRMLVAPPTQPFHRNPRGSRLQTLKPLPSLEALLWSPPPPHLAFHIARPLTYQSIALCTNSSGRGRAGKLFLPAFGGSSVIGMIAVTRANTLRIPLFHRSRLPVWTARLSLQSALSDLIHNTK
jgi:hypothetical protein